MNDSDMARASSGQSVAADASDTELSALARSAEIHVRAAVAAHARTPLTTLIKLAADPEVEVRAGVASNKRAGMPEQVFEDLARDKEADVVYELIANPRVPDKVITRLGRQFHRDYSRLARTRLAATKAGKPWPPHSAEAAAQPAADLPSAPSFPPSAPVRAEAERGHANTRGNAALEALIRD